jgi:hypothetical protein
MIQFGLRLMMFQRNRKNKIARDKIKEGHREGGKSDRNINKGGEGKKQTVRRDR